MILSFLETDGYDNMGKALKIYGWTWVVLIVATIITVVVMAIRTSHHDLAKDPNNIEKIVKVDLPDIAFVESENNLDRSASRFLHNSKTGQAYHAAIIVNMEDGKIYINHAVRTGYIKNAELKTRSNLTFYEYSPH